MKKLLDRVSSLGYSLQLSDSAKDYIAEKGFDKNYGARPLKRAIQKYVEDALAVYGRKKKLGSIKRGSKKGRKHGSRKNSSRKNNSRKHGSRKQGSTKKNKYQRKT